MGPRKLIRRVVEEEWIEDLAEPGEDVDDLDDDDVVEVDETE